MVAVLVAATVAVLMLYENSKKCKVSIRTLPLIKPPCGWTKIAANLA